MNHLAPIKIISLVISALFLMGFDATEDFNIKGDLTVNGEITADSISIKTDKDRLFTLMGGAAGVDLQLIPATRYGTYRSPKNYPTDTEKLPIGLKIDGTSHNKFAHALNGERLYYRYKTAWKTLPLALDMEVDSVSIKENSATAESFGDTSSGTGTETINPIISEFKIRKYNKDTGKPGAITSKHIDNNQIIARHIEKGAITNAIISNNLNSTIIDGAIDDSTEAVDIIRNVELIDADIIVDRSLKPEHFELSVYKGAIWQHCCYYDYKAATYTLSVPHPDGKGSWVSILPLHWKHVGDPLGPHIATRSEDPPDGWAFCTDNQSQVNNPFQVIVEITEDDIPLQTDNLNDTDYYSFNKYTYKSRCIQKL